MKMLSASSRPRWVRALLIANAVCPLGRILSLAAERRRPRLGTTAGRMNMRTLILACAAILAVQAAPGLAQQKPITRADALKVIDAKFAASDANHDGFLSKTEIAAAEQREVQDA